MSDLLISDTANPLGLDGVEFVEYVTRMPQALGAVNTPGHARRCRAGNVVALNRGARARPGRRTAQ